MKISTYGVAFTSYDVDATKKTNKEIDNENLEFSTILESNKSEKISYQTKAEVDDALKTVFKDPVNNKYVVVSLSSDTLTKLKSNFGESDIVELSDGSIRLTNKTEAFVSGWFADIAYNRNFLSADSDGDGSLTEDEYHETFNDFNIEGMSISENFSGTERLLFSSEKVVSTYVVPSENDRFRSYRELDIATSLDDELNTTLSIDSDFDGKVTLEEAYRTKFDKDFKSVVLRNLNRFDISTIPSDLDIGNFDDIVKLVVDIFMQKDKAEQDKIILKLMEKLQSNNSFSNHLDSLNHISEEDIEHVGDLKEYYDK